MSNSNTINGCPGTVDFPETYGSITINGDLSDWTQAQRIDTPANAIAGYALYGSVQANTYLIAIQGTATTDQAIGAGTTIWLNTDRNTATGYSPFGNIGAEYNVTFDSTGTPYLYTGAAGQTKVNTTPLTYALSPDGKSLEIAIPRSLVTPSGGVAPTSISIAGVIDNFGGNASGAVYLPGDYVNAPEYNIIDPAGFVPHTYGTIIINGDLSDWTQAQRIDTPANTVAGYALYGSVQANTYLIAIQGTASTDQVIGAGTTIWLNTDRNTATGYSPFGNIGAEYNVTFDRTGTPYLYTGAAGQTKVSTVPLTYALSPDGKSLEIAIPRSLVTPSGGVAPTSISIAGVIDNFGGNAPGAVYLPGDYFKAPEYTITDPAAIVPPSNKPSPVVTMTSVGSLTNHATQTLTGTAIDPLPNATVSIYDNGNAVALKTVAVQSNGTWSATVTLVGDGIHKLVATDTNLALATGSSAAVIDTLDTIAPTLTVTESIAGLTSQTTDVISGTVSDLNGVKGVEVYDGTTDLGAATVTGNAWTYTATGLAYGTHNFAAIATDNATNPTALTSAGAGVVVAKAVSPPPVNTTASITGTGIDGIAIAATGTVVNGVLGTIHGGIAGIIEAATGKVANAGVISGGSGDGIDMAATGTVTNAASGTITGGQAGLVGAATGTVINAGRIAGLKGDGIDLAATAIITNLAGGIITGAVSGIVTAAGAVVINAGTIGGGTGDAVLFTGAGSRLVVAPTAVFNGNVVAIAAGNTLELAGGTGTGTGTINNFSTAFQGFQTVVVDAGAHWVISGGDPALAITLGAGATLVYDGVASGTPLVAAPSTVTLAAASSFVNAGSVGAATGAVMGASASVLNTGTINGSTLDGLDGGAGGSVTNAATGTISGKAAGILLGANGTVVNANVITGTIGDGIDLGAGSTVTNFKTISGGASGVTGGAGVLVTNSGSIAGTSQNGVALAATGTVANDLSSSITGSVTGVVEAATGKVINAGTIVGHLGDGILVAATGSITNTVSGAITGGLAGIVGAATGTITNAGSIAGLGGDGIDLAATAVVTNGAGGLIVGALSGIVTASGANVTNAGIVTGIKSTGVDLVGPGTVTNAGTISGGNGTAVALEGGSSLLVIDPGAVFVGNVVAAGLGNTLELAAGSGTLGNFASSFHGFQSIVVDAGANWVITGGNPAAAAPVITVAPGGSLTYDGTVYGTPPLATAPAVATTTAGLVLPANSNVTNAVNIINTTGNAIFMGAGSTVTNVNTITGSLSGVTGGAGMLVTNIGDLATTRSSVTDPSLSQPPIVALPGDSTVTLSGAYNLIQGGAGHTMISGGFLNTYEVTAIGTTGGLDIGDFSVNLGDVLRLHDILSPASVISSRISGSDLLISVGATAGSAYVVADLHGMAGTSLASLVASHNITT